MIDEERNYHSRLLTLSHAFDESIERMKSSYLDEKYTNWTVWLLLSPLRDIAQINSVHKGLKTFSETNFFLAIIPFVSMLTGTVALKPTDWIEYLGSMTLGLVLGYIFTLTFYFPKLLQFKSNHFHTGAYRVFRKQEYEMFRSAFLDHKGEYYFRGLYDYINNMRVNSNDFQSLSTNINESLADYFHKEKHHLETKISLLKSRLNRQDEKFNILVNTYEDAISELEKENDELSKGSEYVIELIKDINKLLFRMKNRVFSTKDLNIVSGFTLYERREKELFKIDDVGTTGSSPMKISLDDKSLYKKWGAVKVVRDQLTQPVINYPYENHTIVSVRMNMGIEQEKVWVFNFHFDSNDQKVSHLLVKNDIIDSREVYRLIHALCLLSDEWSGTYLKEAGNDE
ncbi:hypothetical protein [Litchfieldia salsa]|uniref:DH domain-containing protein n=1 Tax=Litchfieldia salsa TaxID=930152 RepID=A0A1H0T6S7_9BACI|nr:hypothetical protein [Litchfieldia salsa]SDP49719.1 hypothetical protein SAMN05216565_103315 [Litchfieldia salsa]